MDVKGKRMDVWCFRAAWKGFGMFYVGVTSVAGVGFGIVDGHRVVLAGEGRRIWNVLRCLTWGCLGEAGRGDCKAADIASAF